MKKIATALTLALAINIGYSQDNDDIIIDLNDSKRSKDSKDFKHHRGTFYSLDFDFGLNNYLQDGKSPDENNEPYAVIPIGSWYFAINSNHTTHLTGPLYLQWGGNLSWYNFKFADEAMRINKQADEVVFEQDPRIADINPIKSKLAATYLNTSIVPMLDFNDSHCHRYHGNWYKRHHHNDSFRIGIGAYAGLKIASHSKFVYQDEGRKEREKDHDSYYMNNWRYGARLQMGFRDVDIFVNYDMSELFVENKGPQLNAFSFGIVI